MAAANAAAGSWSSAWGSGQHVARLPSHIGGIAEVVLRAAPDRHSGAASRSKREGVWTDISFTELGVIAHEIARGLLALGIRAGDRVAVLSSTRPDGRSPTAGPCAPARLWSPVYQTNSPEECQYDLNAIQLGSVIGDGPSPLAMDG